MGAIVGLCCGLGLMLIWRSRTVARSPRERRSRWAQGRAELIRRAGVEGVTAQQLLALQVLVGVVSLLGAWGVTSSFAVSVFFGLFGSILPLSMITRLAHRRRAELRELWPEAIDNLASAVRAGMSLPEGVSGLAERGPEPLRPPFARFGVAYRATGRFSACLDGLKDDLADPVGDRVCETLRVAREVGGSDLGTVLRTLSELLRVDARTRAELETRQSWTVNAARLAVAAPWLVLLMLGVQSDALRAFNTSAGVLLLGIGAGCCVLAYRLMLRLGRLPDEPRVLR